MKGDDRVSLKERTINVDIMTKEYTKLKYKQGESGQNINIKLFKNGKQLDLIGLTVNAFFEKTNGEILEKSATINDNVATITLSKQILNIAGKIKTELYITKGEELVISFTIIIDVEESINASSAVEEKEEWDSIKDLLIKSNNLAMIDDNNVSIKTTSSSYKINSQLEDIKEDLNISKQDNLFIQIGQLSFRKGTLEILDALRLMSSDEVEHNYFFFAGKVASEIHESFYSKVDQLKDKGVHLYIKDEFVSFEFLNSLCSSCDCMLTPYKNTSQSSGAIGYAAQYGKPVIGPSKGLLGYLIKHYKLGYQVNMVCAKELYQAITSFKRVPVPDDYVKDNQMNDFLKLCLE